MHFLQLPKGRKSSTVVCNLHGRFLELRIWPLHVWLGQGLLRELGYFQIPNQEHQRRARTKNCSKEHFFHGQWRQGEVERLDQTSYKTESAGAGAQGSCFELSTRESSGRRDGRAVKEIGSCIESVAEGRGEAQEGAWWQGSRNRSIEVNAWERNGLQIWVAQPNKEQGQWNKADWRNRQSG